MDASFLVFKVQCTMTQEGRGLLIMGKASDSSSVMLSKGELIELRRPDGTSMQTRVYSTNAVVPPNYAFYGLLGLELPAEIQKEDVPPGTEVWFHLSD